jgi:hypothetical protein
LKTVFRERVAPVAPILDDRHSHLHRQQPAVVADASDVVAGLRIFVFRSARQGKYCVTMRLFDLRRAFPDPFLENAVVAKKDIGWSDPHPLRCAAVSVE